jgi:hypothetical protein
VSMCTTIVRADASDKSLVFAMYHFCVAFQLEIEI